MYSICILYIYTSHLRHRIEIVQGFLCVHRNAFAHRMRSYAHRMRCVQSMSRMYRHMTHSHVNEACARVMSHVDIYAYIYTDRYMYIILRMDIYIYTNI